AGAEPAQYIVDPRAGRHEFSLSGAFEVGTAEPKRPLEAAVLVEHHTGCHQRHPGQMIGQAIDFAAIFAKVQHDRCALWRRWRRNTSAKSGSRLAANTATV